MNSFNVVITTKGSKDESDALYERRTVAEASHACLYRDASNSVRGTGPDWWLRVTFAGHINGKGWAKFPLKHAAAMVLNHTDGARNAKASHVEFTATYERVSRFPEHTTTILLPIDAVADQLAAFMRPREAPKPPKKAGGVSDVPPGLTSDRLVMAFKLTHKGRLLQKRNVPWFAVDSLLQYKQGYEIVQVQDVIYVYEPAKARPAPGGTPDGKLPRKERPHEVADRQQHEDDEFARVMRERALLDASRLYEDMDRAINGGILHAARTYVMQEYRNGVSFCDHYLAKKFVSEFGANAWEQACEMVRLSLGYASKAPSHGTR